MLERPARKPDSAQRQRLGAIGNCIGERGAMTGAARDRKNRCKQKPKNRWPEFSVAVSVSMIGVGLKSEAGVHGDPAATGELSLTQTTELTPPKSRRRFATGAAEAAEPPVAPGA